MVIKKSTGVTESEHRLVNLGEKVFMGLWSYPNPQFKKSSGFHELCDLLVVCGDTVLVFSDKNIKYDEPQNPFIAWQRWKSRAITESIQQLHHAENILRDHPEMIWLNSNQRLPVDIPGKKRIKIHLICVANGAIEACKKFCGAGSTGSLKFSNLEEESNVDCQTFSSMPQGAQKEYLSNNLFTIRDYNNTKTFVHVFDDYSFPFILKELDTLTDFVKYLTAKEDFIRHSLVSYGSEEDLLYKYIHNFDQEHICHTFLSQEEKENETSKYIISKSNWNKFKKSSRYLSRTRANRPSYFWDQLVEESAICALDGSMKTVYKSNQGNEDTVLRYMALEDRLSRRVLSKAILNSIKKCGPDQISLTVFLSNATADLLYLFLQVDTVRATSYTEYISRRRDLLSVYINFVKAKCTAENLNINKIIGIAIEPPKHRKVTSSDLVLVHFKGWSQKEQDLWNKERIKQGVLMAPFHQWFQNMEAEWPDGIRTIKIGVNDKCPCGSGKKYKKCCGSVLNANR